MALKWPKTLWLFSASGDIHVMRCGENGEHVMTGTPGMRNSGVDPNYIVDSINGIDNDGGDF